MNKVPEGWRPSSVKENSSLITKGTTPSTYGFDYQDEGVAFFRVENIDEQGGLIKENLKYINLEADEFCKRSRLQVDDVLFSIAGAIGRVALVRGDDVPANVNQAVALVRPGSMVLPGYLVHALRSDFAISYISKINAGLAQLNLNLKQVGDIPFLLPPLPEQRKIAAILSSVDDAIAATQAVIDQTRKVKEGLLQDLLTRGIGHTRFKQTEIGEIPEGWEVKRLENVVTSPITYGIVQAGVHVDDGVPYIRVSDMTGFELSLQGMLRTAPELAAKFKRSEVRAGEVVCALRGVIGHVMRVPEALDGANLTQGTARIAPDCRILSQEYLLWAMRSPVVRSQALCEAKGSALKEVSLKSLKKLLIPIPCKEEQLGIVENLNAVLLCERFCCEKKEQYQDVKRGLMQDLLSGDVRVCA